MRSVHLIMPSTKVSGAEKRFLYLWLYFFKNCRQYTFRLCITKLLYEDIDNYPEISGIKNYQDNITIQPDYKGSKLSYLKEINKYQKRHGYSDIYHFVMYMPLLLPFKKNNIVYTFPGNDFSDSIKGFFAKIVFIYNLLWINTVDILDPVFFKKLKYLYFFKSDSVFMTPGSYLIFDDLQCKIHEKKNWMVYAGRFNHQKNILKLVQSLPDICNILKNNGINDFRFYILGSGELEGQLGSIIEQYIEDGIDVVFRFDPNVYDILAKSKIFFSLQSNNNYPSRSLLEAMAFKNIPIVTDVGTSYLMAPYDSSFYVPENFDTNDLCKAVLGIFQLSPEKTQELLWHQDVYIKERFSFKATCEYFLNLYEKIPL